MPVKKVTVYKAEDGSLIEERDQYFAHRLTLIVKPREYDEGLNPFEVLRNAEAFALVLKEYLDPAEER